MWYRTDTPAWMRLLFHPAAVWNEKDAAEPTVYLTFDDGPNPTTTPLVLEALKQYDAQATFFCVGHNVEKYPEWLETLTEAGHAVGNHTHNHLNGWQTPTRDYLANIETAQRLMNAKLFRPPYGKITFRQARRLRAAYPGMRIIMWSVLSGDFDEAISGETCLENVLSRLQPGDIVIFHDSIKAQARMTYALPRVLDYCKQKHWQMKALPTG